MLELLEAAADQLAIKVTYEPLQTGGISGLGSSMRGGGFGGLCRVNKAWRIIVDKRASNEERDGPIHLTAMDHCEGSDPIVARNFQMATAASTELISIALNPGMTRAEKVAAFWFGRG